MKILLVGINSKYIHTSLGIRCVAEYTKKYGYMVDILEESINTPILRVLDKLVSAQADVYGFSVHIWSKKYVAELIELLQKIMPNSKIVIGGPEAESFSDNINVSVIAGEGEITFLEYLQNKKISNAVLPFDDLPFTYPDLKNIIAQHKIIYYEATRGCPFSCSYCLSSVNHNVRKKSLAKVLAELDVFIQANAPLVKFVDRTYNLDEQFYLSIFEHLAKAKCDTTFHFEIKADLLSEKVLDFLSTVPKNRFQFEVGIQSTNPETLKAINRDNDWEKIKVNCKKILQNDNIHLHTDLIAGLPFENLAFWKKSFNDVFDLHAPMLQLGFLKVLPKTQMAKEAERYGIIYMPAPPYEVLKTKWLSYEDLQFLRKFDKIFDVLYNSGHFTNYLFCLLQDFATPFDFFSYVVKNWSVGDAENYNARTVAGELHKIFGKKYENILQQDIFKNIHHWKPDWLDWREYTHKKLRERKSESNG